MSVNYIQAAAAIDPTASFTEFETDPTNYESLNWSGTPIPKADLEVKWLAMEKDRIAAAFSAQMFKEVTAGFPSDALVPGVFRTYDSDLQGQIVIIGASVFTMPNDGIPPATSYTLSSIGPDGQRTYDAHNPHQIHQLIIDGGTFSNNLIFKLKTKVEQVMAVNTGNVEADLTTIYGITWN